MKIHTIDFIASRPGGAKPLRIGMAAEEAGPMPRRESRRLVEEEQLRPASPAHDVAPPAFVIAGAGDPGLGRPALPRQRLRRRIVDDAAIASEYTTLRSGDDLAEGCHAVLQGHGSVFLPGCGV